MSDVQGPRSDRDEWKDINKPTAFNFEEISVFTWALCSHHSRAEPEATNTHDCCWINQEYIPTVHMSTARKSRMLYVGFLASVKGVIDTSYQNTFHQGPHNKNMENAQFRNV